MLLTAPQLHSTSNMGKEDKPFLNWHYRMGKHEAVHLNPINRLIHWTCIPCQIFSMCLLFSNVEFAVIALGSGLVIPLNLSLVVISCMCSLYWYMDMYAGVLTILLWTPLFCAAVFIHQNLLLGQYEMLAALGFFAGTFAVQVGIGHVIFEEGRDDTEQNIAEFLATWNPIYITCIPFYHHMEIIFNLGLRSNVYKIVQKHQHKD